jgi:16S rRNA G966 N2-methylase RsmD
MAAPLPSRQDRLIRMRIIAGTFRSRQLKSLKGLTLPHQRQRSETLFNILGPRLRVRVFWTCCRGPALSASKPSAAGLSACPRRKSSRSRLPYLRKPSLARNKIRSQNHRLRCYRGPHKARKEHATVFDFIFPDPPYANEKLRSNSPLARKLPLVTNSTIVIAEHHKSFELRAS